MPNLNSRLLVDGQNVNKSRKHMTWKNKVKLLWHVNNEDHERATKTLMDTHFNALCYLQSHCKALNMQIPEIMHDNMQTSHNIDVANAIVTGNSLKSVCDFVFFFVEFNS